MIYFDNAATTSPKPEQVIRAVDYAMRRHSANPGRSGHLLSRQAAEAMFGVREAVADFFNASGAENVIFTSSCTHAINIVIKGAIDKGGHVITSDLEHNAVMRPLLKNGNPYSVARVNLDEDSKTLEAFKALITPATKLIICTAASNVCGKLLPIKEIGKLCKERGILFCVDAAQIAGVMPIDMCDFGIDYLCIAPHKGLYAPMGVGILIANTPIESTLLEGGTGSASHSFIQAPELPEGFESGTLNLPGILGIKAGLDFVKAKGTGNIYKHEIGLIKRLYSALEREKDILLYTPYPEENSYAPVLSFNINGIDSEQTSAMLNRNGIAVRAGLHCAPSAHTKLSTLSSGTVRICPSVFNTKNEVDYLVKVLKKIKT